MFVFHLKLGANKKLVTVLAAAVLLIAVICILCMVKAHGAPPDTAACDELGEYSVVAETEEERLNFLNFLELKPQELVQTDTVTVPAEFNEVYEQYNALQRAIGLDLSRYKGKSVNRFTYRVDSEKTRYAVLLTYNDRIIGGHLTNGEYGDENLPLTG